MVKTTRTTWRSTSVSSFLSEEACWLPLQHATWVRVLFFLSQVVTFLYYKWTQVVVTCFCGSGTGQKYMEGKNMFDLAVAVVQSEGSEVAAVATLRQEHHNVHFREASKVQIEQYHEATGRMCQNREQHHFSEATRELQLYCNRLFAERPDSLTKAHFVRNQSSIADG